MGGERDREREREREGGREGGLSLQCVVMNGAFAQVTASRPRQ